MNPLALRLTKTQAIALACLLALLLVTLFIIVAHTVAIPASLHHLADSPNVPFNRP